MVPAAGGAGELAEAEAGQQGEHRLLLGPGVVEQPFDPGQAQPVRGLPEQPAGDPAAPVGLEHVQVADVGPAAEMGQAAPLGQVGLDLDVADQLVAEGPVEPGAVDPEGATQPQPGDRRLARPRQLVDPSEEHDLGVAVVDEPAPLVQRLDVRPLLGEAVDARSGQRAVGPPARRPPQPEPVKAGRHEDVAAAIESGH
jgi:hypothetical protein